MRPSSIDTNNKIKQSLKNTKLRRLNQSCKVLELKVNVHQIPKEKLSEMYFAFTQAKWVVNDMLNSTDIFKYDYLEHKKVTHFDKDKNEVISDITLSSVMHRALVQSKKQDIVTLSKIKKKGNKVGRLKFKKEVNCIPIITGPWLKIRGNSHITIPGFANLKVYGLEQLLKYPNYELANAKFIKKASGLYINISIMIEKDSKKREQTGKSVGLDFGIKDNITTSEGEKFNCSVQESDHLKFLQRKLSKKEKGSKRYYNCLKQIKKEYEHLTNKKTDDSNKLIAYFLKDYDIVYFQDEQLSKWKKSNKGFARVIQSSYLGRVKTKLLELEKSDRSYKISKWMPTTKYCPSCGVLNTIPLSERTYKCSCGYTEDRDVHASRNVKLFGSTKRAECLEQASVEKLASLALESSKVESSFDETKNEDSTF